jgi:signal transduction histidine kinase
MTASLQLRRVANLFPTVRLLAVPVAVFQVLVSDFPPGYRPWAWSACAGFALGAVVLFVVTRRAPTAERRARIAEFALAFDIFVSFAFIFLYAFVDGQPLWALYYVPVLEAALRFGFVGGVLTPLATAPLLVAAELWRSNRFEPEEFRFDAVAIRIVFGLVIGAVAGRLVSALVEESRNADSRAAEAEQLRDELARRVDLLEAANRCVRALASSLDLDEAFGAFIREVRGIVPFARIAIILEEGGAARVIAAGGLGAQTVFPPGTSARGSLLDELVASGRTVYRADMSDAQYPEERTFIELGLRSRVAAPLVVGPRTIGMLSVSREERDAFTQAEIELLSLLGRFVAAAVQNIRAYESERSTAEELRRLSALRADFVSLVSHELRSPMAAVIGSARTLQARWRELTPAQRESFLALIADETGRLAALIGDVLDTSRIEAGTFSYSFKDVDVAELVRETVGTASIGQDEVRIAAAVPPSLPSVRGDPERLRQVLSNLVDNAVKYSPAGDEVRVAASAENGALHVAVSDNGPGIPADRQRVIFEKFGRAGTGTQPGTGLGLFIARSIVEAHGGSLAVRSTPGHGSTFVVSLPVG